MPIYCSWGAPFSEKRPKLQVTDYITKKVDFRNNGFRVKMRHVWRLASWGTAFLLKQVFSTRTTFVYHKKSEWERYITYPVRTHYKTFCCRKLEFTKTSVDSAIFIVVNTAVKWRKKVLYLIWKLQICLYIIIAWEGGFEKT